MTQVKKSLPKKKNLGRPKISKKWLLYFGLGLLALILVLTLGTVIGHPVERLISIVENRYQQWFDQQNTNNPLVLLPLAFIGGLLVQLSKNNPPVTYDL
ncbi:hypothetical protein WH8501_19165 [Crocosphaera watsonii WH 8501]|uniref:Uncharacterized protein n=1 Tax=Crocosphaera watsonii WH 8501 TaxID=165597 RepID=Q4CAH7_CROWT|nr:hypothetical protein [Crocosphaera watsonii]EAM52959.1 hypothetical protein CwatDRAFT_6631 [Crocosphaera watsonii WH 8501]